jgi:hypothetical protein
VYYWLARERVATNFKALANLATSFNHGD